MTVVAVNRIAINDAIKRWEKDRPAVTRGEQMDG